MLYMMSGFASGNALTAGLTKWTIVLEKKVTKKRFCFVVGEQLIE